MSVAAKAKQVYKSELKARLEADHCDKFVAIEPVSTSFFLGDTFIDAALAAKKSHPDRKSFVIRIGHEAVLAGGSKVTSGTFVCFVDWFGHRFPLQVVAHMGRLPVEGLAPPG